MTIRLKPRDRRAVAGLAFALAAYGVISWLALPAWDRLQAASETVDVRESELQRYRRALVRQGRYEELGQRLETRMETLESRVIRAETAALASVALQSVVEATAADAGVTLGERTLAPPRELDDFYGETAMSVTFECEPAQLVALLAGMRDTAILVTVRQLEIETAEAAETDASKRLRVSLTVAGLMETT